MTGRTLVIATAILMAAFAGALWYFQTYAFYRTVDGVTSITVGPRQVAVQDYEGIDAETSPLKLRACMTLDPAAMADAPPAPDAEPLVAPRWFDCFNARAIAEAVAAGKAQAYIAAVDEYECTERMIAVFPDGSAYMWRQMNASVERLQACIPPDLLPTR